jgi:GNAT superfamily N-acetyltransferase
MANPLDLLGVQDPYEGYELAVARTRRTLHRELARAVDRFAVIVVDNGGRLEGAMVATARTPAFIEWSMLTVRPDARQHGYAWALADRAIAVATAAGLGVTAVFGPGNPMRMPADFGHRDVSTIVSLQLPDRFRGERRLRRSWFMIVRKRPRRPLERLRAATAPERESAGPEAGA